MNHDDFHFGDPPVETTESKVISGPFVVSSPGPLRWADKFSKVPFLPPTIQEQIWVRMRVDDGCVLLEVQYGDDEYIAIAKEPLLSNFSKESMIWPLIKKKD